MANESRKLRFVKSLYYPYSVESVYDNGDPAFPSGLCALVPASIYKIIGEKAFRETLEKFPIYVLSGSRYFSVYIPTKDSDISEVPEGSKVPIIRYSTNEGFREINHVFTPIKWEDCSTNLSCLVDDGPITKTGIKVLKEMFLDRLDINPWDLVLELFSEFDEEGLYRWLGEVLFWSESSLKLVFKDTKKD